MRQKVLNSNPEAEQSFEVKQFCALAQSLNEDCVVFDMMMHVTEHPKAPFEFVQPRYRMHGRYVSLGIWAENINGLFGMHTGHGFLIFVFLPIDDDKLLEWFMKATAEALPNGYEIERASVLAQTEKQLRDGLALRLPVGQTFQLVLQGTEEFGTYIEELMNGTIWSNPTSG